MAQLRLSDNLVLDKKVMLSKAADALHGMVSKPGKPDKSSRAAKERVFPTDPEVIEEYTAVNCWKLAYEIHKRTGWPIISLDDSDIFDHDAKASWS